MMKGRTANAGTQAELVSEAVHFCFQSIAIRYNVYYKTAAHLQKWI
ncbi:MULTISPECIES: hypothetical protein [Paenibacillus]|nr:MULTISPECIES: hypothetical protein [Paenibacillus]